MRLLFRIPPTFSWLTSTNYNTPQIFSLRALIIVQSRDYACVLITSDLALFTHCASFRFDNSRWPTDCGTVYRQLHSQTVRDLPCCLSKILFLNEVLTRIHEFSPTPGRPFVLGLPTGSTPLPTYKALITMVNEKTLSYVTHVMVMKNVSPWELRSFKNVVTFNMDEYVGLPQDHQESFHTFMFREFFSQSEAVWRLTSPLKLTFICSWYPSIPSEYPRWQRRRSNRGVCLIW